MATMTATRRKKGAPSWAFHSCRDMLLSAFITCLVDKDLSVLGGPEDARADKWESIYLEYADLVGDGQMTGTMSQVVEAQILACRITRVAGVLSLLELAWHPGLVEELKIDYPALTLDSGDPEAFKKDVARIVALLKRDQMRLTNLRADLTPKKQKDEQVVDYAFFAGICQELSKFQGYAMLPEGTTVLNYALCLKRFNRHIEAANRQLEKQQSNGSAGNYQ